MRDLADWAVRSPVAPADGLPPGPGGVDRRAVLLTGMASVAAAVFAAAAVPWLGAVSGLALCLLLPGRLLALVLTPELGGLGRRTILVLEATISLITTMTVGLLAAVTVGVGRLSVTVGLGAGCLALALVGVARSSPEPTPARAPARWARPDRRWFAVVPVALATAAFAAVAVGGVDQARQPAGYTELAVERRGTEAVAVVTSHERAPVSFRYEILADGRRARAAAVSLRPGERRELPLSVPTGDRPVTRLEVRLYEPGQAEPYRRVSLRTAPDTAPDRDQRP
jgi:hypothetical protein